MDAKFTPLKSLKIIGFRAFQNLEIPQLGSVNLVVGKNGVGKTSLLEALWIYMNRAAPQVIWEILEARDEGERTKVAEYALEAFRHLYWGHPHIQRDHPINFSISSINGSDQYVSMTMAWPLSIMREKVKNLPQVRNEKEPGILIEASPATIIAEPLNLFVQPLVPPQQSSQQCVFISANGLEETEITRMWDRIALTESEEEVVTTLKLIQPKISKVNLIAPQQQGEKLLRIPVARLVDEIEPVPLRSLGEGMVRLLGLALALVNASNGMLIVDEIESGLHYTTQIEMWKLVFKTAKRLNIQVFATTHSWDCIVAFQQVAGQSDADGMLIRLENKLGKIISSLFNKKDLEIITRDQIEVR